MRPIAAVLAALLAGCAARHASPPVAVALPPQAINTTCSAHNADIQEAVFRALFADNESGIQQRARAYFLVVEKADPPAEFLARFAGEQPVVLPGSAFSGHRALEFSVGPIVCASPTEAVVGAGYYEGPLSASGAAYTLDLLDGHWVVKRVSGGWVSQAPARPVKTATPVNPDSIVNNNG